MTYVNRLLEADRFTNKAERAITTYMITLAWRTMSILTLKYCLRHKKSR